MKKIRPNRRNDYLNALFDLERKLGHLSAALRGAALAIREGDPDGVEAVEAIADVLDRVGTGQVQVEIAGDMLRASYAKRGTGIKPLNDDMVRAAIEKSRHDLAADFNKAKPTAADLAEATGYSRGVILRVLKSGLGSEYGNK